MKKNELSVKNELKWFGNDDDGLSIMDTLTIAMFVFFILFKFIHIYISIRHSEVMSLLSQFNLIMSSMDEFMRLITIFYFSEKTLDNTITKVGNIKNRSDLIKERDKIQEGINDLQYESNNFNNDDIDSDYIDSDNSVDSDNIPTENDSYISDIVNDDWIEVPSNTDYSDITEESIEYDDLSNNDKVEPQQSSNELIVKIK